MTEEHRPSEQHVSAAPGATNTPEASIEASGSPGLRTWRPITQGWLGVNNGGPALLWHEEGRFVAFQPAQSNYWRPGFTHWMPIPEGPKMKRCTCDSQNPAECKCRESGPACLCSCHRTSKQWGALKRRAEGVDGYLYPALKDELKWAVAEIEQLTRELQDKHAKHTEDYALLQDVCRENDWLTRERDELREQMAMDVIGESLRKEIERLFAIMSNVDGMLFDGADPKRIRAYLQREALRGEKTHE